MVGNKNGSALFIFRVLQGLAKNRSSVQGLAHIAGKILREMKEQRKRHPGTKGQLRGRGTLELPKETPELKDLSISKKQAHIWQKIAELKENEIAKRLKNEGYANLTRQQVNNIVLPWKHE